MWSRFTIISQQTFGINLFTWFCQNYPWYKDHQVIALGGASSLNWFVLSLFSAPSWSIGYHGLAVWLKIGPISLIHSVFLFLLFTVALLVIYLIIIYISLQCFFLILFLTPTWRISGKGFLATSHYPMTTPMSNDVTEHPTCPVLLLDFRKTGAGKRDVTSTSQHDRTMSKDT